MLFSTEIAETVGIIIFCGNIFITLRFLSYKGDNLYLPIIPFDKRYLHQWVEDVSNCVNFIPD